MILPDTWRFRAQPVGAGETAGIVPEDDAGRAPQVRSNLQTRILDHMAKADFVPVDVSGFTEAQVSQVQQFIEPLGPSVFIVGQ